MSARLALQKSIYEKLSGNAGLNTKVRGIYSNPPKNPTYPYVIIGNMASHDYQVTIPRVYELNFTLHIVSNHNGRSEAAGIIKDIESLINSNDSLTVDNFKLISLRCTGDGIRRSLLSNNNIYNGEMSFTVIMT